MRASDSARSSVAATVLVAATLRLIASRVTLATFVLAVLAVLILRETFIVSATHTPVRLEIDTDTTATVQTYTDNGVSGTSADDVTLATNGIQRCSSLAVGESRTVDILVFSLPKTLTADTEAGLQAFISPALTFDPNVAHITAASLAVSMISGDGSPATSDTFFMQPDPTLDDADPPLSTERDGDETPEGKDGSWLLAIAETTIPPVPVQNTGSGDGIILRFTVTGVGNGVSPLTLDSPGVVGVDTASDLHNYSVTANNGAIAVGTASCAEAIPTPTPAPPAAKTELSQPTQAKDTVIVVKDVSGLKPGSIITIDGERMRVLGVSGNQVTVERGIDGTEAADHAAGSAVAATTPTPSPTPTATPRTDAATATGNDGTNRTVIFAIIGAIIAAVILAGSAAAWWRRLQQRA